MNTEVDANVVIAHLQQQVADAALQIAIRDAQLQQLRTQNGAETEVQ